MDTNKRNLELTLVLKGNPKNLEQRKKEIFLVIEEALREKFGNVFKMTNLQISKGLRDLEDLEDLGDLGDLGDESKIENLETFLNLIKGIGDE